MNPFPWTRYIAAPLFSACLASAALAADTPRRTFNLPSDDAVKTLRQFTEQSGEQIVYPVDQVRGVRTNAVSGEMGAREALEEMLKGTALTVDQDEKTGALAVRRKAPLQGRKGASGDAGDAVVTLEEVHVLGTRLRQAETAGPSPVSIYDADYIQATGAMTLADFLNYLPQTYGGIASGRGSAPNELNPEFGQRTDTTTPAFNFVLGSASAPPGQTGVSGVSLRGLGSGSTLVLVDGRRAMQSGAGNSASDTHQGFVDLDTIPLGLIDHIEVTTDGASAIYGADAVAGVINIILKKNWTGSELRTTYKDSSHGGGRERQVTLTSGISRGKLNVTLVLDYYDRGELTAAQRGFSANQNHSSIIKGYTAAGAPIYAIDLRLNWGFPGTVQAVSGTLPGITDPSGNATRFAIIPSGAGSTPTVSQFTGVTATSASGVTRGNTAQYIDLIPWSQRNGVSGNFRWTFNDRVEAYGSAGATNTHGRFSTQPAVVSAASSTGFGNYSTVVPAAYNPFGVNVDVGMILPEFGAVTQTTHTAASTVTAGVRGKVLQTWEWDLSAGVQRQTTSQITRNFNAAAITAALSNPDPAQRFNPFLDPRVTGFSQRAIMEKMALYPFVDTTGNMRSVDFSSDGNVADIWGGPVKAAFGGSYDRDTNSSTSAAYSVAVTPVATVTGASGAQQNTAAFAEVSVPLFGKPNAVPLFRRLDLDLAGRYEKDRNFSTRVPKYGVSWSPFGALLLRGSYSQGFRAPALTEYEVANQTYTNTFTVTDPRRGGVSTTVSTTIRGSNVAPNPEKSRNEFYGLVFEPEFAKGLSLQVNYYRTEQSDALQVLSVQTLVNNESLFPGRITRAAPTAADTAAGQPGAITSVDDTFVNFGKIVNNSVDYELDYALPWRQLGRWRLGINSSHTLKDTRQLAPGQPPLVEDGDTFAPPKWRYTGSLFWSDATWNAALFWNYLSGFTTNNAGNSLTFTEAIPSTWLMDLHVGHKFARGIFPWLKGVTLTIGVGNVFDRKPPFSDTVFGYNGGLHSAWALGRSYEMSLTQPF
jgi:outer membrane receptor protein involved in Fe transport